MDDTTRSGPEDAELIARTRAGEVEAFGSLYERYARRIFLYLRSRVGDQADAEDLTEQVFVRSFQSLGEYKHRGHPFSSFLYRVAHNLLIDHRRRTAATQVIPLEEDIPSASGTPEEQAHQNSERDRLASAMRQLPEDYQEIIRLRIILELPTEMAASWMDRSQGATRVLLHRALKTLKERLESSNE
jgi:RNA polymerase sigma-70 factor (ECF subfamily)